MSSHRRIQVPGGTYFFTLRLQDHTSDLLVSHIDVLRQATALCRKRWPFVIEAAVVLPNTLHMIWTLPDGDANYAKRWLLLKSAFSRNVTAPDYVAPNHAHRGEKGIWQHRLVEHVIRDRDDLAMHMHLIRSAPVHAGLAKRAVDWPYSSVHKRLISPAKTIAPAPSFPDPETAVMTTDTPLIAANEMYL